MILLRLVVNTCKYFNTQTPQSLSKVNMNCNKFYFRHLQSENEIHITFLFKLADNNSRQFNLIRKPDETLEGIATRIAANIQKVFNKLNKKFKRNNVIKEKDIELLDSSGNTMPLTITCSNLISTNNSAKLKILDQLYDVEYNSPWIISIALPHSILAGFPIQPVNLAIKFCNQENCVFKWYSSVPINSKGNKIMECDLKWDYVGTGFTFVPSVNEIGKIIKLECIPGNESGLGPLVETISNTTVEAGPGKCPFENRHAFTTSRLKGSRCVSYNILADLYCDSDFTRTVLHPYCPPYALHIDYRKNLIMKELLGYNADILCLQEVDSKIFNHVLQPMLKSDNFEGVFAKKGKQVAEGLACFYRKDRFRFISESSIVLAQALQESPCFSSIWDKIKDIEAVVSRFTNRSTIASATILQSIENPHNVLIVGNTHLYFHPDADHIRLIQGGMTIYWLKELINETKLKMPTTQVSLILCGDFNSVPSCGIYKLYTQGIAPSDLDDWKSNANEIVTGVTLQQDIPMQSACGTPKYTNFTAGFADCLDYIYYDSDNICVEQVIPFPSDEELHANTALPSVVFPSDHIALIADLAFKK